MTELWSEKFERFGPSPIEPFNLVEDGVEAPAVAVLLVPLEVPEEAAELEPLLLPEAEDVRPVDVLHVQLVLTLFPDAAQVSLHEDTLQRHVVQLIYQRVIPDRIRDLGVVSMWKSNLWAGYYRARYRLYRNNMFKDVWSEKMKVNMRKIYVTKKMESQQKKVSLQS